MPTTPNILSIDSATFDAFLVDWDAVAAEFNDTSTFSVCFSDWAVVDTNFFEAGPDAVIIDPEFVDSEVISPSRFGMTAFNNSLKPIVRGDTRKVERTFTGLPTGITINKAWLTVKTTPSTSDPGLFQLEITTSATSSGQITDASTSDGQLGMYFVINGTQSASATGGAEYVYDIQVKDASSGAIHTLVMGTVTFYDGVTGATS